jgi:hypothetical protein
MLVITRWYYMPFMVDYIPFKSIDRYRYTGWWFGTGIL